MDAHDHDLLTRFRANRDEAAFRLLVDRHIGMVYSVARRVTDNSALAEEVAQSTFTKLADKSAGITRETALAGWLYQTSRRLALSAIRSDARRRQREQIAAAMNLNEPSPNVVAEYLEPAMEQLAPDDRDALLLRFFEDRSLRDVGQELGLSEDAARMRVNRAIEKMRDAFAKLGITGTAAWLGTTLTTSATASVPAGLSATITTAVLSGTAVAAATAALITESTATTMNFLNLKTAAAIIATAAVTGSTTYLVQEREAEQLRADNQAINAAHGKLADEQREGLALIQLRDEQIAALKRDVGDLPRLRGEVDRLNRMLERMTSLENENVRLQAEVDRQRLALNHVSMGAVHGVNSETDTAAQIYNAANNNIRLVQAAFEQYLLENRGAWPSGLGQLEKYLSHDPTEQKGDLDRRYVFFNYPGVSPSDLPADAVLITERDPRPTHEGKYYQAYFLADRSVQVTEGLNQMRRGPNNTLVLIRETPVP